jgi:hypothetical protein
VAIVDSATATASSLAELLLVNGLEAPAAIGDASRAPGAAMHRQLTSGDVEAFRTAAGRMFGEEFPDVEAVELEAGVS